MEYIPGLLIISNREDFLKNTQNLLINSGFEIRTAGSNPGVYNLLRELLPDVVLFDFQNTGPDATEFSVSIKSDRDLKDINLILLCDEETPFNAIEKAINAGADEILKEPFVLKVLVSKIRRIGKIKQLESNITALKEQIHARNIFLDRSIIILSKIAKSPNLYKNNFTDFLQEITENTADHLNVERTSIWFFNENKTKIICKDLFIRSAQRHTTGDEISSTHFPVYFENIKKARIVAAPNAMDNPATFEFAENYLKKSDIISMLDSPIRFNGEVAGIICVESVSHRRDWHADEMNFVASISDFLSLMLEINESKKQEFNAQESDNLKTIFISNLSHKLRTPINSIAGFVNLLSDNDLTNADRDNFINIINTNVQRLTNLVNDVVDISKIQAGQMQINNIKTPLNEIFTSLNQLTVELIDLYHKNNLNIVFNLPTADYTIETDPSRLKQIFGYLIDNAVKFTLQGSIEIGYKVDQDQAVAFFVKDTGIGISSEQLSDIFLPFNQFNRHFSRKQDGTGLGLAISNGLVKLMKGTMWFESEYEVGTTFWFKLPTNISQDENMPFDRLHESNDSETTDWTGKKILIVEDVANNYELLEKMIQKTGATIIWADTGQIALQLFNIHPDIALVLMDIKLPDIDGLELTRRMKIMRPNLPIIAQTAFAMTGDREKILASGCDEYLAKPISRLKLLRVLIRFIN